MIEISKILQANNPELSQMNKKTSLDYRNYYIALSKSIYDCAKALLDSVLGPEYSLPIDIKKVAEKLGLTLSSDNYHIDIEINHFKDGYDCLPLAQLFLRKKIFGTKNGDLCGTIHLPDYISDKSVRFAIAHSIGRIAFREQKRIDSTFKFKAYEDLYPLVSTDEMTAEVFAYALLLPYHLFIKERKRYESYRSSWPLDYSRWIAYITDTAQMPEYYSVLACQEIKKIDIYVRYETAKKELKERLKCYSSDDENAQNAALVLYAKTVNSLESRGYPQADIMTILFNESTLIDANSKTSQIDNSVIEFLRDFYITNNISTITSENAYPPELEREIILRLKNAGISANEISAITGIPKDSITAKTITITPI